MQQPHYEWKSSLLFWPNNDPYSSITLTAGTWQNSLIVASSSPEQIFAPKGQSGAPYSCAHTHTQTHKRIRSIRHQSPRIWLIENEYHLRRGVSYSTRCCSMLFRTSDNSQSPATCPFRRPSKDRDREGTEKMRAYVYCFPLIAFAFSISMMRTGNPKGNDRSPTTGDDDDRGFSKDNELLIKLSRVLSIANHNDLNCCFILQFCMKCELLSKFSHLFLIRENIRCGFFKNKNFCYNVTKKILKQSWFPKFLGLWIVTPQFKIFLQNYELSMLHFDLEFVYSIFIVLLGCFIAFQVGSIEYLWFVPNENTHTLWKDTPDLVGK